MVPWNKLCFWSTCEKPEARSLRENMAEWGCTGWHGTPCFDFAARGHEIHIFTAPSDRRFHGDIHEGELHVHFVANDHGLVNCSLAFDIYNQKT